MVPETARPADFITGLGGNLGVICEPGEEFVSLIDRGDMLGGCGRILETIFKSTFNTQKKNLFRISSLIEYKSSVLIRTTVSG